LARSRVRQADAESARSLQCEVQILLMQRDPEAGLEVALDHALAVDLEDARRRESAHQRLAHASRIGTGLGSEEKRLADRLDSQSRRFLACHPGSLSLPCSSDQPYGLVQ